MMGEGHAPLRHSHPRFLISHDAQVRGREVSAVGETLKLL
jgi:hypothetical protein